MLARFVGIAQELASHHAILKAAQDELLAARTERREKSRQEALASTQARTKACKAFQGRVPGGLLRFLYDKGALVSKGAGEASPFSDPSDKFDRLAAGEDLDPRARPVVVSPDDKGVGARVRSLVDSLGRDRVAKWIKQCGDMCVEQSALDSMARLEPKGAPSDSIEQLLWLPEGWRERNQVPQYLRGIGAPWVLVGQTGSFRSGVESSLASNIGQFLVASQGHVSALAWPTQSLLDGGATVAGAATFLFGMPGKVFGEWPRWSAEMRNSCQQSSSCLSFFCCDVLAGARTFVGQIKQVRLDIGRANKKEKDWAAMFPSLLSWARLSVGQQVAPAATHPAIADKPEEEARTG